MRNAEKKQKKIKRDSRKDKPASVPEERGGGTIPPRKCAPTSIALPTNRSGNRTVIVGNPEYENELHVGEDFAMQAAFSDDNDKDEYCSRCEYRQYVRGEFTFNGRRMRHRLGPNGFMSKSRYKEDVYQETPQDTLLRYGHRSGDMNRTGDDEYLPLRPTGCEYAGTDSPGISTDRRGVQFKIDLHFKGQIKHSLTGEIVAERRWRVYYAGVVEEP